MSSEIDRIKDVLVNERGERFSLKHEYALKQIREIYYKSVAATGISKKSPAHTALSDIGHLAYGVLYDALGTPWRDEVDKFWDDVLADADSQ